MPVGISEAGIVSVKQMVGEGGNKLSGPMGFSVRVVGRIYGGDRVLVKQQYG